MLNFFKNFRKRPTEPLAPTDLEGQSLEFRVKVLELRYAALEQAVIDLCEGIRANIDRIDHNTQALDKNMHSLASMTLHPPQDLLGGNKEPN